MNAPTNSPDDTQSTSRQNWAGPVTTLRAEEVPQGATNLNVEGRQVAGALQGFGPLWRKTFRLRLEGIEITPSEVMDLWKTNFQKYQPSHNRFRPTQNGFKPGSVIFIDSDLPALPGSPGVIPLATGVLVLYQDDTSVTVMTPEGHPEAGWNTFSAFDDHGVTIAQIQGYARSADPIYEFGLRYMGGSKMQDETWVHVLESLGKDLHCANSVTVEKECLDDQVQWKQAGNIWKNAGVRTILYKMAAPLRWVGKQFTRGKK